jgi:hypothetical protein
MICGDVRQHRERCIQCTSPALSRTGRNYPHHRIDWGEGVLQSSKYKRLLPVEMVVEGAEWMVVGDQPELGAAVPTGAVGPDVAQDVLMPVVHSLQFLI